MYKIFFFKFVIYFFFIYIRKIFIMCKFISELSVQTINYIDNNTFTSPCCSSLTKKLTDIICWFRFFFKFRINFSLALLYFYFIFFIEQKIWKYIFLFKKNKNEIKIIMGKFFNWWFLIFFQEKRFRLLKKQNL